MVAQAKQQGGNQQCHAQGIQRHRQGHQALRRQLGHHKHHTGSQQHVAALVNEPGAMVKPGRIHGDQPQPAHVQHDQAQGDIEPLENRLDALPDRWLL